MICGVFPLSRGKLGDFYTEHSPSPQIFGGRGEPGSYPGYLPVVRAVEAGMDGSIIFKSRWIDFIPISNHVKSFIVINKIIEESDHHFLGRTCGLGGSHFTGISGMVPSYSNG